MPILNEGADEAEAIEEEIKANRPARFRIDQLFFDKGTETLIRPVTDYVRRGDHPGWVSVGIHQWMPTKPKPEEVTWKWPGKMYAVCPLDKMFRLPDPADPRKRLDEYEDGYGSCYIHDTYKGQKGEKFGEPLDQPTSLTLGLVVLREPVFDASGQAVIGVKDKTSEWRDEKGNVYQVPHFAIVAQRYPKFWAPIKAACFMEPMTATNKDFLVKRSATGEMTVTMANLDPGFMHGTPAWEETYEKPLAMMGFSLADYVISKSTQDYYDFWFVPGATPKGGYNRKRDSEAEEDAGAAAPAAATAAPPIDQALMANFRETLQVRGAKA